jgi:uncharacterized protein
VSVEAAASPEALERLSALLAPLGRLVVGFSGGADSALLAFVATKVLGREEVRCVTAVSPSLAADELEDCRALAAEWSLDWRTAETHELSQPAYRANGRDRCYHCKAELMDVLAPIADELRAKVAIGVNRDDLSDFRPGQRAAAERGAVFPLVAAGLGKGDVRAVSAALGLRTASKPSAPCLASRLPYGTPVTLGALRTVEAAESALRRLGFSELRVRHYGETARLELALAELPRALELREDVVEAVKSAGYRYVTLDLEGLRSGNLNLARPGGRGGAIS